jgi:DNA gyrase inhibitor GyrI
MGFISPYLENKMLDHTFGKTTYTPPATMYYALMTTMPANDGTGGVEVTGGSYARVGLTNNNTNFPNSSANLKANGVAVTFPTPTAGWGTAVGAAYYDAVSGGNLLAWDTFTIPVTILSGSSPFTIASGGATLNFTGAVFGTYLQNKLLDLVWGNVSFTAAGTIYHSLFTSPPNQAGAGGSEVSGGSYARFAYTNNTSNYANAVAGLKINANSMTFTTPTANWGGVTSVVLFDASSGGNLYCILTVSPVISPIVSGQPVVLNSGGIQVSINTLLG